MREMAREVNSALEALGMKPTARWCYQTEESDAEVSSRAEWLRFAERNDADLSEAHVVLLLSSESGCGESFAEARLALTKRIPVIWTGPRRILTTWREGVLYLLTVADASDRLDAWDCMISRPWPVSDEWIRATIWSLVGEITGAGEWSQSDEIPNAAEAAE